MTYLLWRLLHSIYCISTVLSNCLGVIPTVQQWQLVSTQPGRYDDNDDGDDDDDGDNDDIDDEDDSDGDDDGDNGEDEDDSDDDDDDDDVNDQSFR